MKKHTTSILNYFSNRLNYFILTFFLIVVSAFILFSMGRVPVCKCGYVKFWHGVTHSSENSQHLTDFYTFSHIIHGMVFYWLISKFAHKLSLGKKLFIATFIEAAWEIFENTDMVINRYRAATISLDYYGDSVVNSVMDVVAMISGFFLTYKMPLWSIILLIFIMEIFIAYLIRDNLALNIIMLIYPFEFIKNWQSGI